MKRFRYIIIIVAVITLIGGVVATTIYRYKNNIVDRPIIESTTDYDYTVKSWKLDTYRADTTRAFFSNIYLFKMGCKTQLRFRYTSLCCKKEIRQHTNIYIYDENGKDLTYTAKVYEEVFMGFYGLNMTLVFDNIDSYILREGAVITVELQTCDFDLKETYSSCKLQIKIPELSWHL